MKTFIDRAKAQIIAQAETEKEFNFMVAALELFGDQAEIEKV